MNEYGAVEWILSFIITWTIGLLPPLLIRFVFLKRPIGKFPAVGICGLFLFLNLVLFIAMGSKNESHIVLYVIAYVSYWILRKDRDRQHQKTSAVDVHSKKIKTKDPDYIRCANCDFEQWTEHGTCQSCGAKF